MESICSIFNEINLPINEWFLNINNYEQGELIDKSKGKVIYKIKEKNSNNILSAQIFDINMKKASKFKESNLPQILQIISKINNISILNFKGFSPISFKGFNPVIATEYASNGNLSEFLDKERKSQNNYQWTYTKKLINIYGIASGMKYLHSQDIIHRQLQLSSIFLDDSLYPKISNFDYSKKVTGPSKSTDFDIFVEPSYVAPEIWQRKGYSKSSDVYSFSMILYEIITNKKPQQTSKHRIKIMNDVVNKGYRPTIDNSVPVFFQKLIKSCWSTDPNKRPTFSDIVNEIKSSFDSFGNGVNKDEYFQYLKAVDGQQEADLESEYSTSESIAQSIKNESMGNESTRNESMRNESMRNESMGNESMRNESMRNESMKNDDMINLEHLGDSVSIVDINNYKRLEKIGKGGYGTVYTVKDIKTNKIYVAKTLLDSNDNLDDDKISLIIREINLMTELNHPSIIKLIGISLIDFFNDNKATIIMEYASNGSLATIFDMEIKGMAPNGWDQTKKLINIYGIALGMKYMHSKNIIHRDLKPENILENEFLFPKICDFGLSKHLDNAVMTNGVGTPIYMAPELFTEDNYSTKIDVYAFGLILYQFFSTHKPYLDVKNSFQLIKKQLRGERPEFDFDIPTFYRELVEECWSKEPEDRPTFEEIVDLLKNDERAILDSVDIDEFYKYIEYIDTYFDDTKETKDNEAIKAFNKIQIDFSRLLHSKELVISSSIPKLELNTFTRSEKLGSGGFAEVYKIERNETEFYAAKILNKDIDTLEDNERMCVLREVALLPQMNYEAIVKFIGYSLVDFDQESKPVFVTEIAENGSLSDIIELERKGCAVDDWNDTKRLINIYGIACGMKYLHTNSILHRDLKPANVLLDDYLYPKITDFGLSRLYNQINKISEHETNVVGTLQYIAPEIFRDNDYSCASDVYAFAFIVYEIITGEKPLKQFTNVFQIMNKVAIENYRPKFEFPIPNCYKKLIENCWNDNKKLRPSFVDIVDQLKTNKEFINENVDFDEFYEYTELINEVYPTKIENTKQTNKREPTKKAKKITIPNTSQKITELTISAFQKVIEIEQEKAAFNNCFIDLNQFEQLKIISKGEFNKVLKVKNKATNKKYSATLSNIDMNQFSEKEMKNISHEMNLISKIDHHCILKFVGFSPTSFKKEAKPVIINELLKTKTLKEILIKERESGLIAGWNSTKKLIAIYGIASAMNCLHSFDIVHRNLNPSSILLTNSFMPKLYDFGLCTHLLIMNSMTFQSTNKIASSPTYSAPEILNSNESSKSSDVYSFSMIVYEIVTNEKPFNKLRTFSEVFNEVVVKQKRPEIPDEIPECYRKLIECCWSQYPEERLRFDQIVDILKKENGFITADVDQNSYHKYIKQIDGNIAKKHHHHHHHKHHHIKNQKT